jgi:hypothetical protein
LQVVDRLLWRGLEWVSLPLTCEWSASSGQVAVTLIKCKEHDLALPERCPWISSLCAWVVFCRASAVQCGAVQFGAVFADSDGITQCFEDKDASVRS